MLLKIIVFALHTSPLSVQALQSDTKHFVTHDQSDRIENIASNSSSVLV
jgi:hypothetical protein